MHFCQGNPFVSIQDESNQAQQSCPMCLKDIDHHNAPPETPLCDDGQEDCCKDIKIELKKLKAENSAMTLSFFNLSPAITPISWASLFQQFIAPSSRESEPAFQRVIVAYKPPTYLIHCNFRI